jgi:hypothetical protein
VRRFLAGLSLLAAACGPRAEPRLEPLAGSAPAPEYRMRALSGVRDGEVLHAAAEFAGLDGELALTLRFRVGVPTRLESGTWAWTRGGGKTGGRVRERSTDFLGGQSGRPALGGDFELLDERERPVYRVRWPARELTPQ